MWKAAYEHASSNVWSHRDRGAGGGATRHLQLQLQQAAEQLHGGDHQNLDQDQSIQGFLTNMV